MLECLRFDYEGLFAIRPAGVPGFSLPGAKAKIFLGKRRLLSMGLGRPPEPSYDGLDKQMFGAKSQDPHAGES